MKTDFRKDYKKAKTISDEIIALMKASEQPADGCCTPLKEWICDNEFSCEVINNLTEADYIRESQMDPVVHQKNADRMMKEIVELKNRQYRRKIISIVSAAAILIASFIVWENFSQKIPHENKYVITCDKLNYDKPTLILNNGSVIDLTVSQPIAEIKTRATTPPLSLAMEEMNTLIVPKMCTYTITLSDSTQVILNANSEFRYPTVFRGENRRVFLKGEAYFSVTKNSIPFIVNGEGGIVQVYGTKFNVNLRTRDIIEAVLVRGVIGVSSGEMSDNETIIEPHQQIRFNTRNGEKCITAVDVNEYIAWTEGLFKCDSKYLTILLAEIANWHNVKFEYNNESINDLIISASLSRNTPLNELIRLIEINTNVKFIKKERDVYEIEK